jgi:hypothetical protein
VAGDVIRAGGIARADGAGAKAVGAVLQAELIAEHVQRFEPLVAGGQQGLCAGRGSDRNLAATSSRTRFSR